MAGGACSSPTMAACPRATSCVGNMEACACARGDAILTSAKAGQLLAKNVAAKFGT